MPSLRPIPATRIILVENDPGILDISDPFSGLPRYLDEAKAIGTAMMKGNVSSRDQTMRGRHPEEISRAVARASRNAPRALAAVYTSHRRGMTEIINDFISESITRSAARLSSAKLFRTSYERIRVIARKAAAVEQLAIESTIFTEEEKWFRSAVREEISYFHGFLEDIRRQRAVNVVQRIDAYTKALRFMYEAARVQALPDKVLLYWIGPRKQDDAKVCEGCEYLMERSPFPKDTIPAVPRDGSTPCLTNCRHRILVRTVSDLNEVIRRRGALGKRKSLVKRLNEIKEEAGLGRRPPKVTGTARNPFKGTPLQRRTATQRRLGR